MKQMKRILALLFVLIFSSVLNTKGITTYALKADLSMGYNVMISQNIVYYDYNRPSKIKTLNLQEVSFYQLGNTIYKNGQAGWMIKDGTKIFNYSVEGFSPYGGYQEDLIIVYTSDCEWYLYLAEYEEDYGLFIMEENVLIPTYFHIDYDFNKFYRNYKTYGRAYESTKVKSSTKIEKEYYFKNLHQNIGENINESCAYIALGSLLSYYDIFYNDDIIPNTYTINGETKTFIEDEYIHQIDLTRCYESPGYTESFHQFLINEIGVKQFGYVTYTDGTPEYEISMQQIQNVLTYYFNHYTPITNADVEIKPVTTEEEVKNYINQDIPVFLNVFSWLTDQLSSSHNVINTRIGLGHSVIVYGYDEMNNDDTFFRTHLGYTNSGGNNFANTMLKNNGEFIGFALKVEKKDDNCSQAYIYKDTQTEEEFTYCPKCNQFISKDIEINCRTGYESNVEISEKGIITYNLETECESKYDITIASDKSLNISLYKEDGTLVEDIDGFYFSENDYRGYTIRQLPKGKYNIKVSYYDRQHSGTIHTTIQPRNTTPIPDITELSEVDVLPHLHDNHNVFRIYTNQNKLYQMKLVATSTNTIEYPEGAITITDVEGNLINRLPNIDTLKATTSNTNNTLLFYAEQWKSYNIHINYNKTGITSLKLYLTTQEDLPTTTITNNDLYLERYTMTKGDGGKTITIKRVGTYQFSFNYKGTQMTNTYVTIMKEIEGTCTVLTTKALNKTDRSLNYTYNITEPTNIIVCYHNSVGNEAIDIDIGKELTEIFTIQTDISSVDCGSEVKLNNGALQGTTITQGHTRNAYLGEDAPDRSSRLNYYWYSLDESIAKVSAYGTITGVGVGTTKIQAVYKTDPSKVAELEITVIPYTIQEEPTTIQYGMDVKTEGTISGTEITSGKGEAIPIGVNPEVTIHQGYTRLICLGNDSPSSNIQDYEWTVLQEEGDTGMVTVSSYGTMTGTQEGYVTVKGIYKYNPNYQAYIRIQVV